MLVKVRSVAFWGLEVLEVIVEVNVASRGFPGFDVVGLPAKVVSESKQRVKTALINSGFLFPSNKKITVNLAPADLPKNSSMYDLPIAVGIVACVSKVEVSSDNVYFGELSLDGGLRYTKGGLLVSLYSRQNKVSKVYAPYQCMSECGVFTEVNVYGVSKVKELIDELTNVKSIKKYNASITKTTEDNHPQTSLFNDIQGQHQAKRAMEICAGGMHNLFMVGPPGVGKTMLAKAFTQLLSPLTNEESIEVTKIYSISGLLSSGSTLLKERPFRNPHHTATYSGMLGGGVLPKPGEVTLAHRGVLFMDEFAEFSQKITESLRQPLEDGEVSISRNKYTVKYPAKFLLIAACNPCGCGYYGTDVKKCICSLGQVNQYRRKFSGPIIDRFDVSIHVSTPDVDNFMFSEKSNLTPNVDNLYRVQKCRNVQLKRYRGTGILSNGDLKPGEISRYCILTPEAESLLKKAYVKLGLSARACHKIVKVSRTIADFDESRRVEERHISEALQYKGNIFSSV